MPVDPPPPTLTLLSLYSATIGAELVVIEMVTGNSAPNQLVLTEAN